MITLNISNQLELRLIFGSFIKFRNWKFFSFYLLVLENVSWFSSFSPSYGMVVTATLQSISTLELKLDFLTVNFVNLGLLVFGKNWTGNKVSQVIVVHILRHDFFCFQISFSQLRQPFRHASPGKLLLICRKIQK